MFYIIETEDQLKQLPVADKCFISIVPTSDNYHYLLTTLSLIYYRVEDKGYILPIEHSEAFSLSIESVHAFLVQHSRVYCVDQKTVSHYFSDLKLIDVNQIMLDTENKLLAIECNTKVHLDYYTNQPYLKNINQVIPISKHYEKYEKLYTQIEKYLNYTAPDFYEDYCREYSTIEKQGIGIDSYQFEKYFEITWAPYSIPSKQLYAKGRNKTYTHYNLYNLTSRPTNAYNGINFLAINKEDGSRKSIVPTQDLFVEFDFDAYHLKIIANLIGYEFEKNKSIHKILGEQYFPGELSQENYDKSKAITFRQIYGGVQKDYKHIPFFQAIEEYIQDLWKVYQIEGKIVLQTGRALHLPKNSLTPQKLFNYVIQNAETYQNVLFLKEINAALKGVRSKVVLVVYDSFLIDYSLEDGKEVLLKVKQIIENQGFNAKVKVGKNYDSLTKTSYL